MKRWLFSGAAALQPDKQGRVLIPQELRNFAGLEKDVVVVGANNKAEIWDRSRWDAWNASFDVQKMLDVLNELGF
ncbi:division/cell wall cluster transcriptional repressor MraZ [Ruminococcus sp.]